MAAQASSDLIDTLVEAIWPKTGISDSFFIGPVTSVSTTYAIVKYRGSTVTCKVLDNGVTLAINDVVLVLNTSDKHIILGKIKK